MTYQGALEFLIPRTTQLKFGLDTTRRLLASLGDPHRMFPSIHVGGTNGKGSVATLMALALGRAGFRVGLYTSPHLISFRERIRVDGVPITEDAVAMWTGTMRAEIEAIDATFFEATTAMALAHFAARHVDVAVIEVGLGGRLDSTNVITPLVSVVTHIALDHQKYLGDTLEAIAREKAGIAKPGVPFVIGEDDPRLAALLREAALDTVDGGDSDHAAIVTVPSGIVWSGELSLAGRHQRRNAAVAAAALELLPTALHPPAAVMAAAFAAASVPGRFDRRGRWLFDVAHNPDSMAALVESIQEAALPRPIHALVSILGDKDWP
ncbi:MAG: bifunctional folylpolyglutamate synthase/dihydrofolate synthase, partial [Gemmatimonadales bacterium]